MLRAWRQLLRLKQRPGPSRRACSRAAAHSTHPRAGQQRDARGDVQVHAARQRQRGGEVRTARGVQHGGASVSTVVQRGLDGRGAVGLLWTTDRGALDSLGRAICGHGAHLARRGPSSSQKQSPENALRQEPVQHGASARNGAAGRLGSPTDLGSDLWYCIVQAAAYLVADSFSVFSL